MKTCQRCHEEVSRLKARGMCRPCYDRARRSGEDLTDYPRTMALPRPAGRCECGRRLYHQPQRDAGMCSVCAGTAHARPIKAEQLLEDAEWLADTGETLENAARRIGLALNDVPMSLETLERALHRYGRHDLYERLRRNGAAA
jgi:hypothetical protein